MSRVVSLVQAAAVFGVHRNTLAGWLDRGCPYVTKADRKRGTEWQIDTAAVFSWRVETAVKEAVSGYQSGGGSVSREEADRRRAVALAISAEVAADEDLKSVVSRFDVEALLGDFCQALRSALSNTGAKIANRTAAMNRPAEIRDFCQTEINKAFGAAEKDLRERWAGEPGEDEGDSGQD